MVEKETVSGNASDSQDMTDGHFGLAKSFKRRIRECAQADQDSEAEPIVYLWACVTSAGLKQGVLDDANSSSPLTQEQWLNVVDEAASLGANWLILSIADPLAQCSHVYGVGAWAQQVHNMMVGFHLKSDMIAEGDVKALKTLDLDKTRLLIRGASPEQVNALHQDGIVVWTANPQPEGERPHCQGPTRMIFVNAQGVLYTCGLVEGNDAYRMGHVFDDALKHIITSHDVPHQVHEDLHIVKPECDGCPALIANFFFDNV